MVSREIHYLSGFVFSVIWTFFAYLWYIYILLLAGVRNYLKEVLMQMIEVHAEVSQQYSVLITFIVNKIFSNRTLPGFEGCDTYLNTIICHVDLDNE